MYVCAIWPEEHVIVQQGYTHQEELGLIVPYHGSRPTAKVRTCPVSSESEDACVRQATDRCVSPL